MKAWSWLRYCFSFDVMLLVVAVMGFIQVYHRRSQQLNPLSESLKEVIQDLAPVFHQHGQRIALHKPQAPQKRIRFNKHEERCREIFQEIFRQPFPNVRPSFMINPITGSNLELDGYCPDIMTPIGKGLAFEYDGAQHSRFVPRFHSNPYKFAYQIDKDNIKNKLCKDHRILLIRI